MKIPVSRATSADQINGLINHPNIRPWVANTADGVLNMSSTVANPNNHLVMGEHGGIMFGQIMTGVYEAHTVVAPHARGRWTRGMIQSALHYMFTATDAYEITTRIPRGHPAAMAAALGAGMRMEFTIPDGVMFRDRVCDLHVLSFRIQDWTVAAPNLVERGAWFHSRLAQEAQRLGIDEPMHEDCPVHNRYAGLAVEMMLSGMQAKAVATYNRWARLVRHATVALVDTNVVRFDIGLLSFRDGDIEVIRD